MDPDKPKCQSSFFCLPDLEIQPDLILKKKNLQQTQIYYKVIFQNIIQLCLCRTQRISPFLCDTDHREQITTPLDALVEMLQLHLMGNKIHY